jgi:hypothetical protein
MLTPRRATRASRTVPRCPSESGSFFRVGPDDARHKVGTGTPFGLRFPTKTRTVRGVIGWQRRRGMVFGAGRLRGTSGVRQRGRLGAQASRAAK